MAKMKASVIVPAYNAEKSINNSLMSLAEQSLTDFEVLVINDGSTDHTTDVVNDFIQSNKGMNIKLVDKENGGVASARNRGLDEARGKYILFLDADDIYRKDCIECLVSKIERDIADGAFSHHGVNGRIRHVVQIHSGGDHEIHDLCQEISQRREVDPGMKPSAGKVAYQNNGIGENQQ